LPRPADILFLKIAVKRGVLTKQDARDLRDELDRLDEEGVHSKARTLCVEMGFLDQVGAKDLRREVKRYLERKAETESQSSRRVAGFEIEKRLGAGAMGVVYRARHLQTQRVVALKVLNPDLAADEHYLERFKLEAEVASSLEHPNMVQSYAVGVAGDVHYIAMEFVEGKTVKELITRRGHLQPEAAIEIGLQIADALRYAHTRNLVHRDVKPANVMVTKQGQAKLLDLGLARKADAANGLTGEGKAIGTPYYMAPEAALDKGTDYRADIYSFGVTLFTMATGERPFEASTPVGVMNKHLKAPIPDAHKVRDGVPPGLSKVIKKLMAKRPAERYQDHDMLRRDLEAILAGRQPMLKIGKPPPGVEFIRGRQKKSKDDESGSRSGGSRSGKGRAKPAAQPKKKRFPWFVAAAAAGLLVGGAALTLSTDREPEPAVAEAEPRDADEAQRLREDAAQQARSEAPHAGRARARALAEVARQFPNTVAGKRAEAEAKQILDDLFALDREHFDSRANALESQASEHDLTGASEGFLALAEEVEDPDLAERAYARAQELRLALRQRVTDADARAESLAREGREREALAVLRESLPDRDAEARAQAEAKIATLESRAAPREDTTERALTQDDTRSEAEARNALRERVATWRDLVRAGDTTAALTDAESWLAPHPVVEPALTEHRDALAAVVALPRRTLEALAEQPGRAIHVERKHGKPIEGELIEVDGDVLQIAINPRATLGVALEDLPEREVLRLARLALGETDRDYLLAVAALELYRGERDSGEHLARARAAGLHLDALAELQPFVDEDEELQANVRPVAQRSPEPQPALPAAARRRPPQDLGRRLFAQRNRVFPDSEDVGYVGGRVQLMFPFYDRQRLNRDWQLVRGNAAPVPRGQDRRGLALEGRNGRAQFQAPVDGDLELKLRFEPQILGKRARLALVLEDAEGQRWSSELGQLHYFRKRKLRARQGRSGHELLRAQQVSNLELQRIGDELISLLDGQEIGRMELPEDTGPLTLALEWDRAALNVLDIRLEAELSEDWLRETLDDLEKK